MGSKLLATRRRATRVDRRKKVEVEVERVTVDRGCSYHQPSSVAGDAVNVDCLADKAKQQLQRHIDILDEIQRIDIRWYRQAFGLSQEQFARAARVALYTVQTWESGSCQPRTQILRRTLAFLTEALPHCVFDRNGSDVGPSNNNQTLDVTARRQLQRHIDILDEIQRIDIRWYRQAFGFGQEELARILNRSVHTIWTWENGRTPRMRMLRRTLVSLKAAVAPSPSRQRGRDAESLVDEPSIRWRATR